MNVYKNGASLILWFLYFVLQSDYHNLIGITAELVDSLEQCINGNMVSILHV